MSLITKLTCYNRSYFISVTFLKNYITLYITLHYNVLNIPSCECAVTLNLDCSVSKPVMLSVCFEVKSIFCNQNRA